MNLKKITLGILLGISSLAHSQQVVDLSTGVVNGLTTLIPVNNNDDTWQVEAPGSGVFGPVKCGNGNLIILSTVYPGVWLNDPHVRWLSPNLDGAGNATTAGLVGDYTYKTTFTTNSTCSIANATINLNKIGGDNAVTAITVNGHAHGVGAGFNPLLSPAPIVLSAGEIVSGLNTITITVNNVSSFTGLLVYGNLTINYAGDPNLIPAISGATNFCSGAPLTFTGSSGSSVATSYYWEITPSDASGNPTGPSVWNAWTAGAPGSFTFPSGLTLPCGNYYKIKLALANACVGWVETSKVIFISCLPTANAGPDVNLCSGSCTTIGTYIGMVKFTSFNWSNNSGYVGSGQQISVCPTTTTTYTLTVTNTLTGCSSSDAVIVNVQNNNPAFNLASNINATDNFFTTTATPVNLSTSGIAGFGFSWIVEEIVSPTNTTVITGSQVVNSSCWWSGLVSTFNGYDGSNLTNPMAGGCTSPTVGHFVAGHTYRITRGTWSTTCPWQQYAVIVYMGHGMSGSGAIISVEDNTAPDYSSLVNTTTTGVSDIAVENNVSVYPNPSTGVFSIELSKLAVGTIEVYNSVGERVQKLDVQDNTSVYKIDLSGYSKGIYLLNFISNGQKISKKIIVE